MFFISNNEYDHLFLENSISDKTIGIKVGKRINNKYRFSFSPKFISKNFFNIKESLNFNYFVSEFEYELDTRDIFWSPQKGYRLINKLTPLIGENQFITWDFSSSVYIPLLKKKITSPFILAINTTLKRKWGYRNDVWLNYFGNSFNIRGWVLPNLKTYNQNTKYFRFGHEYIFFSLELRKLIESKKNYKFSFNKGLDMVLFFDGGYISNNIITAEEKNFMFGLGIGFRIPFPLLECFRIDFAWGLKDNKINNKPTVHFAIKQKF